MSMNRLNFSFNSQKLLTNLVSVLILVALALSLSACDALRSREVSEVARYGEGGKNYALRLVRDFPFRKAGSAEERSVAVRLQEDLEKLGYSVSVQDFNFAGQSSQNLIVEIPGKGFEQLTEDEANLLLTSRYAQIPSDLSQRLVVIAANYDSFYSRREAEELDQQSQSADTDENGLPVPQDENTPKYVDSDGIDDNAAAVATLYTLAQRFKSNPPAFNVRLVFLGAGHADYAGAKAYFDSLDEATRQKIQVMVNLERIYAGDKVYAHAGQNSIMGGQAKDYAKRQSLYICTDVYYNNLLLTNNGFSLYTNQAGCQKDLPGLGQAVYREWSEHRGNHSVFDEAGIPIVFFESANYDFEDCTEQVKQSTSPYFANSDGQIAGTPYDSSDLLLKFYAPSAQLNQADYFGASAEDAQQDKEAQASESLEYKEVKDQLEIRINNLAFIISELANTSPYAAKAKD